MLDAYGKELKVGQKIVRIVPSKRAPVGHKYVVRQYSWQTGKDSDDLIADGGKLKEKIIPGQSEDYAVIENQ